MNLLKIKQRIGNYWKGGREGEAKHTGNQFINIDLFILYILKLQAKNHTNMVHKYWNNSISNYNCFAPTREGWIGIFKWVQNLFLYSHWYETQALSAQCIMDEYETWPYFLIKFSTSQRGLRLETSTNIHLWRKKNWLFLQHLKRLVCSGRVTSPPSGV